MDLVTKVYLFFRYC